LQPLLLRPSAASTARSAAAAAGRAALHHHISNIWLHGGLNEPAQQRVKK
jgi:hypothetical protein